MSERSSCRSQRPIHSPYRFRSRRSLPCRKPAAMPTESVSQLGKKHAECCIRAALRPGAASGSIPRTESASGLHRNGSSAAARVDFRRPHHLDTWRGLRTKSLACAPRVSVKPSRKSCPGLRKPKLGLAPARSMVCLLRFMLALGALTFYSHEPLREALEYFAFDRSHRLLYACRLKGSTTALF
jgi:hypothetical protein